MNGCYTGVTDACCIGLQQNPKDSKERKANIIGPFAWVLSMHRLHIEVGGVLIQAGVPGITYDRSDVKLARYENRNVDALSTRGRCYDI